MDANHILMCHGICKAERDSLLEAHRELSERLEALVPGEYNAGDVAKILETTTERQADAVLRSESADDQPPAA